MKTNSRAMMQQVIKGNSKNNNCDIIAFTTSWYRTTKALFLPKQAKRTEKIVYLCNLYNLKRV